MHDFLHQQVEVPQTVVLGWDARGGGGGGSAREREKGPAIQYGRHTKLRFGDIRNQPTGYQFINFGTPGHQRSITLFKVLVTLHAPIT